MKRIVLFVILFSLSVKYIIGQQPLDTLFLKNGSVVYGIIRESSANQFRIQTVDGFQFSFPVDQVDRYVSRAAQKEAEFLQSYKRPEKWGFTIQSGLNLGSGDESFFLLGSINPMLSYTFDNRRTLSAGTGLEVFEDLMLPLFLEYKLNFTEKNITPFFYIKAGGLFHLQADERSDYYSVDHKNGWTFGTGLGYSWPMGNIESFVSIGYKYAYTYILRRDNYLPTPSDWPDKARYNRFEMSWGFKF